MSDEEDALRTQETVSDAMTVGDEASGQAQAPSVRQQERAAVVALKEALIEQAERGAITWGRTQGLSEMQRLMAEWKQAGHAAKAADERLWQRFKAARDLFYGRLDLEQQQRRAAIDATRERKSELIALAEAAAASPDIRQAADKLAELMTSWKQLGHAGKGVDDDLWRRFKAIQDGVFATLAERRRQDAGARAEAASRKRDIIAQAQALVGTIDVGPARARMRELVEQFHAAGFAGRTVNPDLNALFHQAQDTFYEWAKAEPERRKASGHRDQYYVRSRKLRDVDEVRSEIARIEAELAAAAPSGKRQHGSGVTLSLGDLSQGNQLRAELMRLRLREQQLSDQVASIEEKLANAAAAAEASAAAAVDRDAPATAGSDSSSLGGSRGRGESDEHDDRASEPASLPRADDGHDAVEADRPAEVVGDDVGDAGEHHEHDDAEQDDTEHLADGMAFGE